MSGSSSSEVRQIGAGRHPVICLHGWFGSGTQWTPIEPYLDTTTLRYYFPDYRGYGGRRAEQGAHSIAEAANDVLALADRLEIERFSLVGHSMGGSVMQRVYADAPERVRCMVGVSPVPASGVPFDEQSWQLFTSAAGDPDSRRTIVDLTTGNRLTARWLDAIVRHSLEQSDATAFDAYLHAWANTDFHTEVSGARVPVLGIVGENDPALGKNAVEATFGSYYPNFELVELGNAGHYSIDETPIALVTTMERFLERH